MTSQLASQLQRLQQRPDESKHRLAKSFLFSTQDAQSFSREQIHQLALNGLQTLTAMDNRFHPFIQDLFDVKKVRQERSMLTSSEDTALRARLEHFLTLLSPHLFLTAAQQVFEFLVRVYEVHVHDVPAVLRAFLPYHDHNIFARALLLLDLRDSGFDFLSTNQLRGAPLLREHLVLACAESRKAARLLCLTVAMPFRYEIRHHAANAVFASVVTQLATHKDGEALWRTFLPFVLELLSGAVTGAEAGTDESKRAQLLGKGGVGGDSRVSQESVATALVVLAAWSGQVRFSTSMLSTVLKPLFRYVTAAAFAAAGQANSQPFLPVRDLLAFLEIVFATQQRALADVSVAPLIQSLLALPWRTLAAQLPFADATEVVVVGPTGVPSTSPRHSTLLAVLLQTSLDWLTRTSEVRLLPSDVVEFLSCAAEDLPLSNALAARCLRVLMTAEAGAAADDASDTSTASSLYHRMIAALERRYAVVFDEVLSEVLLHAETAAAASAFLARHFQGTRYRMVEVGSALAGTTESLPLFACLLHPVAEVRALAAKTLQGMTAAQWMGSTANGTSPTSSAPASSQSLMGLFSHVVSYEHVTSAAESFVMAGSTMVRQLAAQATDGASTKEVAAVSSDAACKLIRAYYAMTLSLLKSHAEHAIARAEALRRVVLPLLTSLFRPAVAEWTAPKKRVTAPLQHLRACVLYHATLLYVLWTSAESVSAEYAAVVNEVAGVIRSGCDAAEPFLSHPQASPSVANPVTKGGKEARRAAAAASSDSDDDTQHAGASSSLHVFQGLLQCDGLLEVMRTAAQEHLPSAFAAARIAVKESSGDGDPATTAEVVVAMAATILPVKDATAALDAVSAITAFLHGTSHDAATAASSQEHKGGYLDLLYAVLLEKGSGRRVAQVGRGSVDATTAARQELHKSALVQHVSQVLRAALHQGLATGEESRDAAALTVRLCKALGYLGASLPAITVQPGMLAVAYLSLIDESPIAAVAAAAESASGSASVSQHVDWYALVAQTVFGTTMGQGDEANASLSKAKSSPSSLAALALVLFLPLHAPATQRLSQLRVLQDAVVTAGSRRGACTGAQATLAAAMQQHGISVTALSCLIECMAVEERQHQLTTGAAELLCTLLTLRLVGAEPSSEDGLAYVVPAGWAHRVVRYFFAASPVHESATAERSRGSSASSAAISPQQMCLVKSLLSRVESILIGSGGQTRTSKSTGRGSARAVSSDAAELVEAVCRRLSLWGEANSNGADGAVAGNPSVRLIELLLQHPYLHVHHGGGTRPVYHHALTALTVGLSYGVEARSRSQSAIFTTRAKKAGGASGNGLSKEFQLAVASHLRPAVLRALDLIGTDVAVACMQTLGGYEYFFLPLLASAEKRGSSTASTAAADEPRAKVGKAAKRGKASNGDAEQSKVSEDQDEATQLLRCIREIIEAVVPATSSAGSSDAQDAEEDASGADRRSTQRWRPQSATAVSSPLLYADAQRVLRLPHIWAQAASHGKWALNAASLQSLELLRTCLQVVPMVVIDDDDDAESAFALVDRCLELYPLQEMEVLLRQAASAAAADEVAMLPRVQQVRLGARGSVHVEGVLRYVESLVRTCTEQTRLLSEKVADGAHRIKSRLLREMMLLMASVLVDSTDDEETSQQMPGTAEQRTSELHFNVDTIAGLLRATAPLLKLSTAATASTGKGAGSADDSVTHLHIPLVSLLIKLEPVDNTEALGFRSAGEVCQEILTSFDIRTQVQCIAQLMRLVADPAAQLAVSSDATAEEDESAADLHRVQHLFRKMVKPNQVINRQETIMHLINLTVKSDLFLEPFLSLQRHARSSQSTRKGASKKGDADGEHSDGDDEADKVEGVVQREDGGCMELLVSALELFAHYHDLHAEHTRPASAGTTMEESEAYTALLELLAGNTLACVLAGINEPTFVVCQQRLLEDKRAALRKIGLEVLLDRLHHSLPTLENVVSDEEMEAHRRRLRDPRERLSLVDLVRIKARPLTTKRSIVLFPLLVKEVRTSLAQFHAHLQTASTDPQSLQPLAGNTPAEQLLTTAQLAIASVEELIRIVSSGGSLQSERTLLNANRSKRVTEANLIKLFGNRSRVAEVHEFVALVCDHWMPLLTRCEMRLRSRSAEGASSSPVAAGAAAEEGVLGCMTCFVTTLATMTQVMGTAFSTSHALALLHTLVSAGIYQVVEMPGVVALSQAGALLRHSTLSSLIRCFPACWQMTQPYLPSLLFIATHVTNVADAESHYLCAEMLAVLEAVMEPQLLLEAGTSCLQGVPYVNAAVVPASEQHQLATLAEGKGQKAGARRVRRLRVQVHTNSFPLLFSCIERRIENLSKDELVHMPTLMEGTSPQHSFWLAAFHSLASAPTVPSSEAVVPVLDAFTVFLLKFKAKHGVRLLRVIADWAFAESSGGVTGASRKRGGGSDSDENNDGGTARADEAHDHDGTTPSLSRLTLQSWIVFFALGNHLLRKLGSILDFAFPVLLPHAITTLRTYCAATATSSKPTDSLVALALEGSLECVRGMAQAQTPGPDHDYSVQFDVYFANAEVFSGVMPALVHQLHNLQYLEDTLHNYRFRIEHNVIPAIRAFMACLGSGKLQSKTQAEIVRALRHPSRHVRRGALVCLDGIYADGGEELVSRLMAEMLPTVVELTEDRDDAVVEEARKLCNNLSHMTGQDVLYAMS